MNKVGILVLGIVAIVAVAYQVTQVDKGLEMAPRRPCQPIVAACRAAGLGGESDSRQSMYSNCLLPVFDNGKIGEVTFEPDVIDSCRKFIQQQRQSKRRSSS